MSDNKKLFEEYPDILTVDDLTSMLHIGKNTAYTLVQTNQIKSLRIGRRFKIPKYAVIDYITV